MTDASHQAETTAILAVLDVEHFGVVDEILAIFATFFGQQIIANAFNPGQKCSRFSPVIRDF